MSKPSGYSSRNTRGPSTSSTKKTTSAPQPSNYSWYQGTSPSPAPIGGTMMHVASTASPDSVYMGIFGTYTPETILNTKITEYSMTGEDFSHEPEWIRKELEKKVTNYSDNVSKEDKERIQEYSQQIVTGEAKPTTLFEEFNEPYTEARLDVSSESIATKINQGEEYMTPTSLSEAKMVSDRVYMDTLKHRLTLEEEGSEEYARIEEAIKFGPQDFSNPSNAYGQLGLGFNSSNYSPAIEEAARFQAATVKDYLESNNIPLYQETDHERIDGGKVYLNTGTALQFFEEGAPSGNKELGHSYHINSGELGSYSNYELTPPPRESNNPLKKILNVASAVLSVMYPPLAPIFSGVNTLVQGGDLEDAFKSAGKAYVGNKIGELANSEIIEGFDKLGFDITALPQSAQNIILDTSKAVLKGDSGTDEFKESATGELLDAIKPDFDFNSPDIDFNTPQFIKDFGDEIYAGIKAVGDVAEEGINIAEDALRPVGDFAEEVVDLTADAFEPVVDFVDEGLDYFGEKVVDPTLQASSDVLSNVEDVAKEGGRVVDDTLLQPIKEFGEDAINKVKELVDNIPEFETPQFSSLDIDLPEMPDIDLPDIDLPDIDLPDIDLNFGSSQPEPLGGLFNTELGKIYKQDIKEIPELFSDEDIQNILSRKYRV